MAGLGTGPSLAPGASAPTALISSGRHFATIAWLRWRIFVNSLRGKGATGELVAKIISYPVLGVMILGPSIGAGIGSYYLVHADEVNLLAIPLWIIFVLWQFIGINTSTTGPSFDLSSLIRFPIRYRDYLLIRLAFGLMDPPTLAGIACLFAMSIGIALASPGLFPWSVLALAVYAACNILFSRMIYSWIEKWLATRRTRELMTGIILAFSLGVQFVAQYAQRLSHQNHRSPASPFLLQSSHILVSVNWLLPPGLTAASIDNIHRGAPLLALAALGGVLLYTGGFLLVLHARLRAQYLGEDLSEAPALAKIKTAPARSTATAAAPGATFAFLPATVAACLIKEIRYLLRSGPKLYVLIMPVFIVFLFSMRTSGMSYAGVTRQGVPGILFAYGCAYMQLIFVSLLYNSLGGDGSGVQFYFIAPLRIRDVILAKNLLTFGIFALEAILIYVTSAIIAAPAPADLTAATLAWSLFTLFANMSFGNLRSITSPKALDIARVRSQNVGGLSSLISIVVVGVSVLLGSLAVVVCRYFHTSYWPAAAVFLVLAAISFAAYLLVLQRIDGTAASNIENLSRELSKV